MAKKMGGLAKAARRKLRKRAAGMEVRRKREFTYRGYTLDEMKATFVERFRAKPWEEKGLRTHCRDVPILPDFVGKKVSIHNGKAFETVEIKPEMIGHYIGEFAMTRKPVKHSGPGVGATRSSKFMPLK